MHIRFNNKQILNNSHKNSMGAKQEYQDNSTGVVTMQTVVSCANLLGHSHELFPDVKGSATKGGEGGGGWRGLFVFASCLR